MAAADIVIGRLLDELKLLLKAEYNLHRNSKEKAKTLAKNLEKIKLILDDAESKQMRKPLVKSWLEDLQAVAYDVEDALDDWEANRAAAAAVPSQYEVNEGEDSLLEKVRLFVKSLSSCCKGVVEHRSISLEIKDLNEKIEKIYNERSKKLELLQIPTPTTGNGSSSESQKMPQGGRITTSGFIESHVHGREEDKKVVKAMLLSCNDEKENKTIPVVSIVGAGGLGKTTLAKMVYKELESDFDKRIWVCVSDPFDQIAVARQILEQQLDGQSPSVSGLEALIQLIGTSLEDSKFLLVLDDVWIDEPTMWEPFSACLSPGVKGSVILLTTRKHNTSKALGSDTKLVHTLQPMDDKVCWSIISQLAFSSSSRNDLQLETIGKEIAKKCAGSPLAAKVLGGLLLKKTSVEDWRRVLNSEIWELDNVEDELFRHFFLSYDELDPTTKRCFSFCAVFPKDFNINMDKLIRMWMAQGFLSSPTGKMEVQGQSIFDDLSRRSFFQDFKDVFFRHEGERIFTCKMHDIVHDFAQYLTKHECVVVEGINSIDTSTRSSFQTARHLTWVERDKPETLVSGSILNNATKLRTFLCQNNLPSNFLKHLKCVRELSLHDCSLSEVPTEIGNLIHLRYLDLSLNSISVIHRGICNLINLQTLDLMENFHIRELPQEMGRLVKLRHVSMSKLILSGLARLPNLCTLVGIIWIKKGGEKLGCLAQLNQLEGNLSICLEGLDEDADVDEAKKAALIQKKSINTLALLFEDDVKLGVVEALQPNSELLNLAIRGRVLPNWITSMPNLRLLHLHGVRSQLPYLWNLPFLEELTIEYWRGKYLGREFLGVKHGDDAPSSSSHVINVAFPSLKTATFFWCEEWKEWEDISEEEEANLSINIMPRLTHLEIQHSMKLKVLPHHLLRRLAASSLQTLKGKRCPVMDEHYGKSTEQENKASQIPNVDVLYKYS